MIRSLNFPKRILLLICSFLTASGICFASDKLTNGKIEFQSSCSSCHGLLGRGDGKMATGLVPPPPDLTMLSARNGGTFPLQLIKQVIDGRDAKANDPHGSREMPVWGDVYRTDDGQPQDLNVRNRIEYLLAYLQDIQRN